MVDLYIKFIFGIISTYGIVVMNYTLFKIQVTGKDKQIVILALVLGTTNFYFKFVQDSNIFLLTQVIIYTIAMTLIRKYPLLYALAVCVIGIIAAAIVDVLVTSFAIVLKLSTIEQIKDNTLPFVLMHLTVTMVYLLVALLFVKYKFGFSFIRRKFSGINCLKPATFMWAFFLTLSLGSLQFITQNYILLSQSGFAVVLAAVALNACVIYAYFQNKKSLNERYGETKKVD